MSNLRLRPATGADHGLYLRFFAELGTQDPPLGPARWEQESVPVTVFLMDGDREVGYAAFELSADNAHVRHVVIDPTQRRRGLGRRLMLELAALLRRSGARAWRLNVFNNNHVAIDLYSSLGMNAIYSTAVLRLAWEDVCRLPHEPSTSIEAPRELDGANETEFGLMQGQLARAREKLGVRIVAALAANGKCVGIAVFDPSFPGSFPLRCKSPEYARTLIEALRARYDGPASYLQLVIEDAALVARVLESSGAVRTHDIVHMRGQIPVGEPA